MSIPELTLEKLLELRPPRLDPAHLPLRAIRRDLRTVTFDWAAAGERPLPEAPELGAAEIAFQLGPFSIVYDGARMRLQKNGVDRFRIEPSWFGGEPHLAVEQTAGGVDIAFTGAFYPGTLIPASLKAGIRGSGKKWTIRLRLKYGHFDATLPLSDWLDGSQLAVSAVHPDFEACPIGVGSRVVVQGSGLAAFTPAWLLGSVGADLFRFDGFDTGVTADLALVGLIVPGIPGPLLPAALRRTLVLFASDSEFPLQPELSEPLPRVHLGDFRFDSLALEAGLLPDEKAGRIVFASSAGALSPAGLEPGGDLWGGGGEPFRIPLRDLSYVQLFDDDRQRLAAGLVAEAGGEKIWLHSPGVSLLVARSPTAPQITVLEVAKKPLNVGCRLWLHKTAPRLEGMIVRPEPARSDMVFAWRPLEPPLPAGLGAVEIDVEAGQARILLPPNTSLAVVRRDDFLVLGYQWWNRRLESRGKARRLLPQQPGAAHLAVNLAPQSIGEETFFEPDPSYKVGDSDMPGDMKGKAEDQEKNPIEPRLPPVKALMAKPSRLVFKLSGELEVTAQSLLDWSGLEPALAPTALPGAVYLAPADKPLVFLPVPALEPQGRLQSEARVRRRAPSSGGLRRLLSPVPLGNLRPPGIFVTPLLHLLKPALPSPTTTQIELPFRLILSPNSYGTWVHAPGPVDHGGWTELWHTRLAVRTGGELTEGPSPYRTVRAIWSRDHDLKIGYDKPFLMPLDRDDRRQLVDLTSDFTLGKFIPTPVSVRHLMLSALGGWLDSDYRAEPHSSYSVEQWRHRATMGRDHYVRVVYKGFLCPFGHRASLVKISERKVQRTPAGDPAAYLRQRMYIVCREPERAFASRAIPFKRVRVTTLVTPNLDPPWDSPLGAEQKNPPLGGETDTPAILAFWPRVGNADFLFHLKTWDWESREVDYHLPLAFVRSDWANQEFKPKTHPADAYTAADPKRRDADLDGQQVAFAKSDGYEGKTTFDTSSVRFKARALGTLEKPQEPPFYPEMEEAQVAIAALRQMTGSEKPARIQLDEHYLEFDFGGAKNLAGIFAKVSTGAEPVLDYRGNSDRSGGVTTPSMVIRGLSRELGTMGDVGDVKGSNDIGSGHFEPSTFFGGANPQLLGGIGLADILESLDSSTFLAEAPKLVTVNSADKTTTTLEWSTSHLKTAKGFVKSSASELYLKSVFETVKDGGETKFSLYGKLSHFKIELAKVVVIDFETFEFVSEEGKKPDVHVELAGSNPITFIGDLAFLSALDKILSPANFSDPPYVDVTPQGIAAGYNLTIPTVAMGVFALQNLALGARLSLPFTGDPMRLRFNISELHDPFTVSVAPFGGGGFFALAVGVDGVEVLEGSIEFGGNFAVDLGVASGGVSLMAGIYLKISHQGSEEKSDLTGYVRANGELEVIGIISISMEFYFGLTYSDSKAWGEVRVTVDIDVLVFHGSVTVKMRKEFEGSSKALPFGELMPQPRWEAYAAAFAEEASP